MDYEKHIEEIQKISNSINAKLNKEAYSNEEWHEKVMSTMNLLMQCKQVFEEKNFKIETDREKLKSMNEQLEKDLDENSKKLAEIKNKYKKVTDENKGLKKEYDNQTQLCKDIGQKINLSQKDKEMLNMNRMKYEIYKKLTNIVWDYTVPHTVMVSGYVRNPDIGYIHSFEFKRNEISNAEFEENMWKELDLGTGEDCTHILEIANEHKKTEHEDNLTQNN